MTLDCPSCLQDTSHCHGSLILHADRTAECTAVQCRDLDSGRHVLMIECRHICNGCRCLPG